MNSEQEKPSFRDWFDLNSSKTRHAYRHFRKHGQWPSWFNPWEYCQFDSQWYVIAEDRYIRYLEDVVMACSKMLEWYCEEPQ